MKKNKASSHSSGPNGRGRAWVQAHADMRQNMGLGECQAKQTRCEDLIELAEEFLAVKHTEADGSQLFTDVSQSAARKPWSLNTIRSVTTSSAIYSHAAKRLVVPPELFHLLGYPRLQMSSLSSNAQADLLGECMSVPCVTLGLYSLILSTPALWH